MFAKDVHKLARFGVTLMDSTHGGLMVNNGAESSLVLEVKKMHDQNHILVDLKENVHKQRLVAF